MIEDAKEILELVNSVEEENQNLTHDQIVLHDAVRSLCANIIAGGNSEPGQMIVPPVF